MKKRFLLPLVAIGSLTALSVFGQNIDAEQLAECNAGNLEICSEVSLSSNIKKITNETFLTNAAAKAKAEAIAEANKPVSLITLISRDKNRSLSGCRSVIKSSLKDPSSYREVGHDFVKVSNTQLAVRVTYSATNSFGGRLQKQQVCGL